MALELKLDRDKMHTLFSSWRLQPFATVSRHQISVTGRASGVESTALDFLHTRASVMRNHLLQTEGRLFVFTQTQDSGRYHLYELLPTPASDEGVLARQVAALTEDAGEEQHGGAVEAVVDCSLAVVAEPQQPAAVRGTGEGAGASSPGDGAAAAPSASGGSGGDISAVAWAMRGKESAGGQQRAACCEVYELTLRASEEVAAGQAGEAEAEAGTNTGIGGGARLSLSTVGVRLLLRTKLPPHLARVLPPSAASAGGAAGGGGAPIAPGCCALLLLGFDPNTVGLEEEDEEGPAPQGGGAAAAMDEDNDDDVDPRTLEAAAARLAHLTSAERSGPPPAAQWADIYKESGPDGVGAMGGEPVVDLAAWRLGERHGGGGAAGRAGAGAGAGAESGGERAAQPVWRLSCGAHRLLSAEGPLRAADPGQPAPPASQPPVLLGLTDDVDCAVLCVERAAADGHAAELQALHAVSIPALAYVAAGKTYKRHLLLASPAPAGGAAGRTQLAAVLVESQRFMYLYGATSVTQEYGRQQVVDLGLEDGEAVLGARLLESPPAEPAGSVAAQEGEGGAQGRDFRTGGAVEQTPGPIVMVATQRRLLSYRLRI
ncbi:hypothetical protein GPECTOR_1g798 [Gonium pectorale]|uniref:Uncharacterized protein n=1 Tax=Gonium pectorale TaxID=33097 RepID=A0A150H493_GONPE|nr:hypothetical protein GPECTOR_1g798 [Gonium pectorale]|eukprot:KXZ56884.1 hypothetical protein GPECTOR_1g798 [Gonium pectorale]